MKNKVLTCMAILGISCTMAYGSPLRDNPPAKNVNSKANYVVDAFIEANLHTNAGLYNQILSENARLDICHGKKLMKHSKDEIVKFFKKQGRTDMNCEAGYEILSTSNTIVLVQVNFKFPTFVQKNFVTIERDKGDGDWLVTQVSRFNENI